MSRPGGRPPLMETRKVLQAARPPVGEGPPLRDVLAGLRRSRPPGSVLVAAALMAVVPLALVGLALVLLVDTWTGADGVWRSLVETVLFAGTLLLLAALAWRGVKRAVHFGSYREGLFLARLTTVGCVAVGGFLLWWVVDQGNPEEASMALPFLLLAVVWLPVLPLRTAAARQWPDQVLLRSGPQVRSTRELAFLLAARPHACGHPLPVEVAVAVADGEGRGWVWRGACPHCGEEVVQVFGQRTPDAPDPADPWAWGRPGSRPGLGGGDLLYLADRFAVPAGTDPATLTDEQLRSCWQQATAAVQASEELLALVGPGRRAVAPWHRTGRPVPLDTPGEVFSGTALTARLADRRAERQRLVDEATRRGLPLG